MHHKTLTELLRKQNIVLYSDIMCNIVFAVFTQNDLKTTKLTPETLEEQG